MRTFRATAVVGAAATLLVLLAGPASAHEEINPKVVSTGAPTFLTLTAANETKTDITKVVLTAPKGIAFGEATKSPSGWTAAPTPTAITWSGGKIAPEAFDTFGFELDNVAQPGTLAFGVALTSGGDTENVTVNVTAAAGGAGSTTTAAPAQASPTTVATAPVPPATVPASITKSVDDAKSRATTAAVLGAIGIGLGVIAIVLAIAMRGRGRTSSAAPQDF